MNCTRLLSEYVCNAKFEDFSPEVIEKAREIVKDYFACAIGGSLMAEGKAAVAQVRDMGGARESTVIGTNLKVPAASAAFANATLSNILDFDDTYAGAAHPSNTIVSAALAMAERVHATGKEFFTAVIVGYEVATRVGDATRLSKDKVQRLWPGICWQAIGAVAACCKLQKLDLEKTINAFGLAGAVVPVPLAVPKFSHSGLGWFKNGFAWTTYTSVFWSIFAETGLAGCKDVFDDPGGFWEIIGSDRYLENEMVDGLGEDYRILGVDLKPFPCCRWTHSALTVVSELAEDNRIDAAAVKEVRVSTIARIGGFMSYPPQTFGDVSFCFPYHVALAIQRVTPGPEWFDKQRFTEPACLALQEKVKFSVHPQADRLFEESGGRMLYCEVEIEMEDGTVYAKSIEYAKGTPQYPMSDEEWNAKFAALTVDCLPFQECDKLLSWVETLEKMDSFVLPELDL